MQRVYDKDPYAILGIPPTATASQIRQAYHKLARQYHPDLNKDPRAAERMKDINWANGILGNPQERSLYDFWRNSGVRVEFHPGSTPPPQRGPYPPYSPPPRNPPPPSGGQARSTPPYTPPPNTVYSNVRAKQNQRVGGCYTGMLIWFIIIALTNAGRIFQSSQRTSVVYVPMNVATQTARYETLVSFMGTLDEAQGLATADGRATLRPLYQTLFAPSTIVTALPDEFGNEDLRSRIVPGSQEWEWINRYFPQLTTSVGLSDEVTLVLYDQIKNGYQIKTRSDGEYWILVNVYDGSLKPVHFPLTETATPLP